jgi:hypothetical protein
VLTDGQVGIAGAGAGAFVVRKHTGKHGTLERDIYVILRPCVEALVRFHSLGGDACLREKSVCQRRDRQMPITEAAPKLNSTQGARASNQSGLMRIMWALLFDGGVDIVAAFRVR